MSNLFKVFSLVVLLTTLLAFTFVDNKPDEPKFEITSSTRVWDVMTRLGKVKVNVADPKKKGSASKGQQLVTRGWTLNLKARRTPKTSKKFTCVACHSIEDEHPSPAVIDPQKRLEHADTMDMPFLPGPPFKGIVNRIRFFNDDYQKIFEHKKADDVKISHQNIRMAIRTCNALYAKGRELEDWEVESILEFFWTMELRMGMLDVSSEDKATIITAIETNKDNSRAVNIMRRYYPEVYPVTLVPPIPVSERKKISPVLNSFSNGKRLYRRACLHCHAGKRYSRFKLDMKQKTFKFLKKYMDKENTRYSIYSGMRYAPGQKTERLGPPHYSSQRMSDQQIQDLRFFVIQMARLGDEALDYYKNF